MKILPTLLIICRMVAHINRLTKLLNRNEILVPLKRILTKLLKLKLLRQSSCTESFDLIIN